MSKQFAPVFLVAMGLFGTTDITNAQGCVFDDEFSDSNQSPNWVVSNTNASFLRTTETNGRVECWAPNTNNGYDFTSRFEGSGWYIDMTADWALSTQYQIQPSTPSYGEIAFGFLLLYQASSTPGYIYDGFAFSAGTYNYGEGVVNFESTRYWQDGYGELLSVDYRNFTNTTIYVWYNAAADTISYGQSLGNATRTIGGISNLSSLPYAQIGFLGYTLGYVSATTGSQLWADNMCVLYGNLVGPTAGGCCTQTDCVQTLQSSCSDNWRGQGTTCEGPSPCQNEPLLVPDDYPTIAAAIAAAEEGDEIIVAAGVHFGKGTAVVDPMGKALLIRSNDGAEVTFLDGENMRHVVSCNSGETSETIIQGFTILNGTSIERGGGIRLQNGSSPKFENCTIRNCSAEKGGGCSIEGSNPIFLGCSFLENESLAEGGAIDASGESNFELASCTVRLNVAGNDPNYAAINIRDTSLAVLSGTLVCDNVPNEIIGDWLDEGNNEICDGCGADLTGDGQIDGGDLTIILGFWGPCPDPENCLGDITGDGIIDGADLTTVLGFWGPCR